MINKLQKVTERLVFSVLGQLENTFGSSHRLKNTPTFIIGPPRSGTTLLGQIVSYSLATSYIPNLAIRTHDTYNKLPPIVTASQIAVRLGLVNSNQEKFESYYGSSKSMGGSSDSDFIWRDILPDGYLNKGCLSKQQQKYIYRVIAGVEKAFDRPFVDKCVGHSLRIPSLLEMFPSALFVVCKRNPIAVAQSVYFGRNRNDWTRKTWLTPQARGYEELHSKDLLEQCAGQQSLFERDIESGLSELAADRYIEVDYDEVCSDPERQLQRIANLMLQHGIEVKRLHDAPKSFRQSNIRRVEKDVYDELVGHLERIYDKPVVHLLDP